jgi:crooked neck
MVAGDPILARQVFERGNKDLRNKGFKAESTRLSDQTMNFGALLEAWKAFEKANGHWPRYSG